MGQARSTHRRVHLEILPQSGELLLEAALAQTTSKPTILVVDSLSRLKNFTSKETADCVKKLQKLSLIHI